MAMETMTRVNEQMDVAAKKPMAVQPGVARMRELTPAQRRAVMFASEKAGVSLGYLSEVERGQKEASSELLSSIADALGVSTSRMLRMVADYLDSVEG